MSKLPPWRDTLRVHPDHPENEPLGFSSFVPVSERYEVTSSGLIVGIGPTAREYAPITRSELPQVVASLVEADDNQLLGFCEKYGNLGFAAMGGDTSQRIHMHDGQLGVGGDPIEWILAHARTVRACLELVEVLRSTKKAANVDEIIARADPMALLVDIRARGSHRVLASVIKGVPPQRARVLLQQVINPNIQKIHRELRVDPDGKDRSFFTYRTVIEAVYWQLADAVEGGIVRRCARPTCRALFIQRHGSQRHCAPRFGQAESPCAIWMRQQKHLSKPLRRKRRP